VYAPALVAFVSAGDSQGPGGGTVGWFALAPGEVYRPPYAASREYFYDVNVGNTVINRDIVTQYYGSANPADTLYANREAPGGVTAVPVAVFAQSGPVAKESLRAGADLFAGAAVTAAAPVMPVHASLMGPPTDAQPPEPVQTRQVLAQLEPPLPPVPFAARQSALAEHPGRPLDAPAVAALQPATAASAAKRTVKVVEAMQPVAAPARPASVGRKRN
jgi:hypothetical protein